LSRQGGSPCRTPKTAKASAATRIWSGCAALTVRPTPIFRAGRDSFFVYGFAKSERANISAKELKALKKLADELLGYSEAQIASAAKAGELIELVDDDDDEEGD